MNFNTCLLRVDGTHDATLDDLKRVCDIGKKMFQPGSGRRICMLLIQTLLMNGFFGWLVIMMMQLAFAITL